MHRPIQPRSLSWWGEVGNSLIFQQIIMLVDVAINLDAKCSTGKPSMYIDNCQSSSLFSRL